MSGIWLRIGDHQLYCWLLMCAVHIVWPLGKNAKEFAWNDKNANTGNYVRTLEKYKSDDVYMSMSAQIESFHVLSSSGGTRTSNQDGITSNMYKSRVHVFKVVHWFTNVPQTMQCSQPVSHAYFMSRIEFQYWCREVFGGCRIEYATECKIEDAHKRPHNNNIGEQPKCALCAPATCPMCVCDREF